MTTNSKGGCLCGAIKIEVDGEPKMQGQCHCLDCRKATGAAFATIAFFPEDKVKISGDALKSFTHTSDSGNKLTKNFCTGCGSLIFGTNSMRPGVVSVYVGLLESAPWLKPQFNVWTSRALPGTFIDPALSNFEKGRT